MWRQRTLLAEGAKFLKHTGQVRVSPATVCSASCTAVLVEALTEEVENGTAVVTVEHGRHTATEQSAEVTEQATGQPAAGVDTVSSVADDEA